VAVEALAVTPVGRAPSAAEASGVTKLLEAAVSSTKRTVEAASGEATSGSSRRTAQ
tara:strand:+ start:1200 stop:1367 length:168 start_codon:yes stop_codon:yes gene_type:complete